MKFSILAKRIAEKTGTPHLENILMGGRQKLSKTKCIIWTGGHTKEGIIRRSYWAADGSRVYVPVAAKPLGRVNFEGAQTYVHRLIYERCIEPLKGKYLTNTCHTRLCVNPHHWEAFTPTSAGLLMESDEELNGWSFSDVESVLKVYFQKYESLKKLNLEDEILDEVPLPLLKSVLKDMKKEHLLP